MVGEQGMLLLSLGVSLTRSVVWLLPPSLSPPASSASVSRLKLDQPYSHFSNTPLTVIAVTSSLVPFVCVCARAHAQVHVGVYVLTCAQVCVCMCTYMHMCAHMHVCVCQ